MSKRRGALSTDEDAIERRKWYSDMQSIIFKRGNAHPVDPASELNALIAANAPQFNTHTFDDANDPLAEYRVGSPDSKSRVSTSSAGDKSSKHSEVKLPVHEFKSFTLVLAEESEAKAAARDSFEEKEPEIIPFTVPENLDPKRWMIKLNELPMDATLICRLICFPGINGSHMLYKKWGAHLEEHGIELWGVCYPGTAHRVLEPTMEVVNDIAECVVEAMYLLEFLPELDKNNRIVDRDSPGLDDSSDSYDGDSSSIATSEDEGPKCMFFGHSVGGLVAYETVRAMQERFGVIISDLSNDDDMNSVNNTVILRDASHLVHHCIISACEPPNKVTKWNRDRYNTRHFCGSDQETIAKILSMGHYQSQCKTKLFVNRHLTRCLPSIREGFKLKEKYFLRGYKWVQDRRNAGSFGGGGSMRKEDMYKEETFEGTGYQLYCPISTLGCVDDDTVTEEELYEWYKFTSRKHAQYVFPSGRHMYLSDYSNETRRFGFNTPAVLKRLTHICVHGHLPGVMDEEVVALEEGSREESEDEEEEEDTFPFQV